MPEFLIVAAALLVFLVFISRKGMKHLLAAPTGFVLPIAGGLCAALLEALPMEPMSPGFTLRTLIAVIGGVFAGRLVGKVARLWAMGHERRNAGNPDPHEPRLVHPLIAAGMFLAGVPALWHLVTSNHSSLEEQLTPRDAKTGIAHGFEEVRLSADGKDAALLLHDLYGSPAEFGDLPKALHDRGFAVFAPLLPGHGTHPDDLDRVWDEDYRKAATAAFDALAEKHARVVVVGNSFGGTLAVHVAAQRKPSALVLANPFAGELVTPSWCPVPYESLVGPMSRAIGRRISQNEDLSKTWYTQSLHAARQALDMSTTMAADAAAVKCPVTVIVGDLDRVLPPDAAVRWAQTNLEVAAVRLPGAGHQPFRGPDAARAIELTLMAVTK